MTDYPDIGTYWVHRRGGNICKVVGLRAFKLADGTHGHLVEYRYRRNVGGLGRNRTTPTQAMELGAWRALFTKEVVNVDR